MNIKGLCLIGIIGVVVLTASFMQITRVYEDRMITFKTTDYQYDGAEQMLIVNNTHVDNVDDIRYCNGTLYAHKNGLGTNIWLIIPLMGGVFMIIICSVCIIIDIIVERDAKRREKEFQKRLKARLKDCSWKSGSGSERHSISVSDKVPDAIKARVEPDIKEGC